MCLLISHNGTRLQSITGWGWLRGAQLKFLLPTSTGVATLVPNEHYARGIIQTRMEIHQFYT
jgi:hypothetical protein